MIRLAAVAALTFPVLAQAQVTSMPAIPGVPGKIDAALDLLVCFEWDQATPFPVACPPSTPSSPVSGGCVSVEITGNPVSGMTLHDFEITFADFPQQTAAYFTQGTIDYVITECTLRMSPGAQPITGVYNATGDHFALSNIPIELEGQLLITGTSGEAGDAFPVSSMELADFVFPDASGAMTTTTDPDTGDLVVVLSVLVGAPFAQPGGRLDVGSGFVVGLGGGALAVATGDSCSTPACTGDTNGDGALTPADFTAWINAYNNNLPACDQNGDGACTPSDFTAWIANFNAGC
ncbi:MAG: hypothetical protein ED559_14010 [Phycisphaera sp.]|nr:MAG: hypothetical protein ED559_14010 [Phycisphaera sp.]